MVAGHRKNDVFKKKGNEQWQEILHQEANYKRESNVI